MPTPPRLADTVVKEDCEFIVKKVAEAERKRGEAMVMVKLQNCGDEQVMSAGKEDTDASASEEEVEPDETDNLKTCNNTAVNDDGSEDGAGDVQDECVKPPMHTRHGTFLPSCQRDLSRCCYCEDTKTSLSSKKLSDRDLTERALRIDLRKGVSIVDMYSLLQDNVFTVVSCCVADTHKFMSGWMQ